MRIFIVALRVAFAIYAGIALSALATRPAGAVSWNHPHHAYIGFADIYPSGAWHVEEVSLDKNPAPMRSLSGPLSGFCEPTGFAIGPQGNLYVAGRLGPSCQPAVEIFARGAHGNAAPIATIEGNRTRLTFPQNVAFDRAGDLYVAQIEGASPAGSINEYASGAAGNAVPIAHIAGSLTGLGYIVGLAIDGQGDIFTCQIDGLGSALFKFAPESSGNVAPIAASVVDTTNEIQISGGTLYASMPTFRRFIPSVDEFSTTDLSMTGELTNPRFTFPFVDVDTAGRIYVQNMIRNDLRQLRGQLFEFGVGGEGPNRVRFDGLAEVDGYIVVGP